MIRSAFCFCFLVFTTSQFSYDLLQLDERLVHTILISVCVVSGIEAVGSPLNSSTGIRDGDTFIFRPQAFTSSCSLLGSVRTLPRPSARTSNVCAGLAELS